MINKNRKIKKLIMILIGTLFWINLEAPCQETFPSVHEVLIGDQESFAYISDKFDSTFFPAQKPNVQATTKKFMAGLGLILTNYILNEFSQQPQKSNAQMGVLGTLYIMGSKLLFDACFEYLYMMYDKLYEPLVSNMVKSKRNLSKSSKEKLYEQIIDQRDGNISRIVRGCQYTISLASTAYMTYVSFDDIYSMIRNSINPIALSFPEGTMYECPNGTFCTPLIAPMIFLFNAGATWNAWRELKGIRDKTFHKRGNVPLVSLITGLTVISLSNNYLVMRGLNPMLMQYLEYHRPDQLQIYISNSGYNLLDVIFEKGINLYGKYRVYESLLLLVKNLISYLGSKIELSRTDIESNASMYNQPKRQMIDQNRSLVHLNTIDPRAIPGEFYEDTVKSTNSALKKEKVKTKGQANLQHSGLLSDSPREQNLDISGLRKQGLDEVTSLRNQYPVKKQVIDSALKNLVKFLDARIIGIDGSEYKIVWTVGNKQFSLKYEVPHGFDHNNYSGNKLNRILNLLEVGYLIGLDEDQIQTYIQENNRYNLLRFPKLLNYLLLNPTK